MTPKDKADMIEKEADTYVINVFGKFPRYDQAPTIPKCKAAYIAGRTKSIEEDKKKDERIREYQDGIKMFLAWLEKNRPTVAGLGAPIHLLKQLITK